MKCVFICKRLPRNSVKKMCGHCVKTRFFVPTHFSEGIHKTLGKFGGYIIYNSITKRLLSFLTLIGVSCLLQHLLYAPNLKSVISDDVTQGTKSCRLFGSRLSSLKSQLHSISER